MRIPALFISLLIAFSAQAEDIKIKENAPDRYTVIKGDTLWDISGKFLKSPWKWPEVWRMNKDQIRNPHLIYPGDVIHLIRGPHPQLTLERRGLPTIKISPQARIEQIESNVPSIPQEAIAPFLNRGGVIAADGLSKAPRILGSSDERVLFGRYDLVYANDGAGQGNTWQIVRQGRALKDPYSGETLGYEMLHVGEAVTVEPGSPETTQMTLAEGERKPLDLGRPQLLRITQSDLDVVEGDRLLPRSNGALPSYAPHAPDKDIAGYVVSVLGGVQGAGPHSSVVINLGSQDGLAVGHVLGIFKPSRSIEDPKCKRAKNIAFIAGGFDAKVDCDTAKGNTTILPERKTGLLFVYRVFDKSAYGLILNSDETVYVKDAVKNP